MHPDVIRALPNAVNHALRTLRLTETCDRKLATAIYLRLSASRGNYQRRQQRLNRLLARRHG